VLAGGYPIASGTCDPGFCDSPLVNDFLGSKATINVDMAASYDITDWATLTLDALNLTNQTTNRWAYAATRDTTLYSSTGRQIFLGVRLKY
jgi:outer membrane receptor protein involved in Fe transport